MKNYPNIPNTWGIPDDQATKVRDALSKKFLRPEDAAQKALEEIARDIAIIEPDPQDWEWWVMLLFEKMVQEAERRRKRAEFDKMLEFLKKDIE